MNMIKQISKIINDLLLEDNAASYIASQVNPAEQYSLFDMAEYPEIIVFSQNRWPHFKGNEKDSDYLELLSFLDDVYVELDEYYYAENGVGRYNIDEISDTELIEILEYNNLLEHSTVSDWRKLLVDESLSTDEFNLQAYSLYKGQKYVEDTLQGIGQSDWIQVIYPATIDKEIIKNVAAYYFNTGTEWTLDDVSYYVPLYGATDKEIKEYLANTSGIPVGQINLRYYGAGDEFEENEFKENEFEVVD